MCLCLSQNLCNVYKIVQNRQKSIQNVLKDYENHIGLKKLKKLLTVIRKCDIIGADWLKRKFKFFLILLDTSKNVCIIVYIMKETEKTKKVRVSKKALIAQLLDKGVDQKIVDSLARANIQAMKFVLDQIG